MGQIQTVTNRSMLSPGDHIYTDRAGYLYFHHGIYVGDDRVIHFQPASKTSPSSCCKNCGYNPGINAGIIKTCVDCFLNGHKLYIFLYGISERDRRTRMKYRCSAKASRPADEVVKIATDLLLGKDFGKYNFVSNNCEDFASFCKTGIRTSYQRQDFIETGFVSIGMGNTLPIGLLLKSQLI